MKNKDEYKKGICEWCEEPFYLHGGISYYIHDKHKTLHFCCPMCLEDYELWRYYVAERKKNRKKRGEKKEKV